METLLGWQERSEHLCLAFGANEEKWNGAGQQGERGHPVGNEGMQGRWLTDVESQLDNIWFIQRRADFSLRNVRDILELDCPVLNCSVHYYGNWMYLIANILRTKLQTKCCEKASFCIKILVNTKHERKCHSISCLTHPLPLVVGGNLGQALTPPTGRNGLTHPGSRLHK